MGATRYASVLGLGFGDCGKGHFIDALTRRWHAHTVVRFNGGAQAGHNVVTPENRGSKSRHHTFSQFGAGTLIPGTYTLLVHPTVVHPSALLVEAEALGRIGINDALSRLKIDAQCRLTTPYHQAAGRLRERLRGVAAHGTCGVGVGETVGHSLEHPEQVLRYGDLADSSAPGLRAQSDKLQAIRSTLLSGLSTSWSADDGETAIEEFRMLQDERVAAKWLMSAQALARQCPPVSAEEICARLKQPGAVLFEGAQGVLLDEWRGFHPHTTWSSIHAAAVDGVAARFGVTAPIEHFGVLRSYLTRHGTGPFPTHDALLDEQLPESHNNSGGWQGAFRCGHPDGVLLRYALEAVGKLSGLLISHLDVFTRGVKLQWCDRYIAGLSGQSEGDLSRIPFNSAHDLNHQSMLAVRLRKVRPVYATELIETANAFLERISRVTTLPIILRSDGPTYEDVHDG